MTEALLQLQHTSKSTTSRLIQARFDGHSSGFVLIGSDPSDATNSTLGRVQLTVLCFAGTALL